jgi:hypothetical protein
MGADFLYAIIPTCKWTPDRLKEAKKLLVADEERNLSKKEMQTILTDFTSGKMGRSREANSFRMDGLEFLLTGGISWGDTPTDLYDSVQALENQLWGKLMAWAKEDAAPTAQSAEQILKTLQLAVQALNTAPRFKVGDTDSYKIAALCDQTIAQMKPNPTPKEGA